MKGLESDNHVPLQVQISVKHKTFTVIHFEQEAIHKMLFLHETEIQQLQDDRQKALHLELCFGL